MNTGTTHLLKTLGSSSLAFLIAGGIIKLGFSAPAITLLIDRSYCSKNQWTEVSQAYNQLYKQHQQQKVRLQSVVLFSAFDQDVLEAPPSPADIETLDTYGQAEDARKADLKNQFPNAQLIGCHRE